jgi:hypothetical protein
VHHPAAERPPVTMPQKSGCTAARPAAAAVAGPAGCLGAAGAAATQAQTLSGQKPSDQVSGKRQQRQACRQMQSGGMQQM